MSVAILIAGEDRWTGVGRSTRYTYEQPVEAGGGIPAREVADDLVAWFLGQRGRIKRGMPPALDLGSLHLLIPEDVLNTPKHQTLWRRLSLIWRNREKDPELLNVVDVAMARWAKDAGEVLVEEQPAPKGKRA